MKRFIILLFVIIVKNIDAQQWCIEYQSEQYRKNVLVVGDNSDKYDYFVGNTIDDDTNDVYPLAICVDENGNYLERIFEIEGRISWFTNAMGMEDGNVFVTALISDDNMIELYKKLWIAVLNPKLDILYENYMTLEEPYSTYISMIHILSNYDNDVVLLARVADFDNVDYMFYKFDESCNLLVQSCLENNTHNSEVTDFVTIPNTNHYAIFGNGLHYSGLSNVNYIDENFNLLSTTIIDDMNNYPDIMLPMRMSVDYWYDDNVFLMSAQSSITSGINKWRPLVVKMDAEMNIIKTLDLERVDTTDYVFQHKSMSCYDSDNIYIATFWRRGDLPNDINIYHINDKLDLLGMRTIDMDEMFFGMHTHAATDGGCIIQGMLSREGLEIPVIYKYDIDDFEINVTTSNVVYDSEMRCFPNPVSSVLNINIENIIDERIRISIFDESGRRYLDREILADGNTLSLDISPLEEGTYFYVVSINDKCILKDKFIKK